MCPCSVPLRCFPSRAGSELGQSCAARRGPGAHLSATLSRGLRATRTARLRAGHSTTMAQRQRNSPGAGPSAPRVHDHPPPGKQTHHVPKHLRTGLQHVRTCLSRGKHGKFSTSQTPVILPWAHSAHCARAQSAAREDGDPGRVEGTPFLVTADR